MEKHNIDKQENIIKNNEELPSPENINNIISLNAADNELAKNLIEEDNLDVIKNIAKKFSVNQAKKNILRIIKLNSLLDKVSDQAVERFEKRPDEISNRDLISYMQVVQNAIDKSQKYVDDIDTLPIIQLNKQENIVNINVGPELDRDSKERVIEVITTLLAYTKQQEQEDNIIDIETEDIIGINDDDDDDDNDDDNVDNVKNI